MRFFAALLLCVFFAARGWAGDAPPSFAQKVRDGTQWQLLYTGEVLGNLSGGFRRGAIYEGLLETRLTLDLEKIAGFQQTTFYANVLYPHGPSLTERYVGDFNVLSNIDAKDTVRLFELWVEKKVALGDTLWALRAGKLAIDSEFMVCDSGSTLLNSCFGALPTLAQSSTYPIWPLSAPAVRLEADRGPWIGRAGVYDIGTGTELAENQHGTRFALRGSDGALFIGEVVWRANPDDASPGPRTTFKLGGFYDTSKTTALHDGHALHGNGGVYFSAEQQILRTGSAGAGPGVFSRASFVPPDRNEGAWYLEGGADWKSLWQNGDTLAAGVGYLRISDDFPASAVAPAHHETVLELTYQSALLGQHLRVQPDFQCICHPGGVTRASEALVAGLRFNLAF